MKIGVQIKLKHGVLYQAMLRHGMNQSQMARHLGIRPEHLGLLMNMRYVPKIEMKNDLRSKLEYFCGCAFDEIFPHELSENIDFLKSKKRFDTFIEADPQFLLEKTQSRLFLESPLIHAEREQAKEIIEEVISTLSDREAAVIRLHYFDGMTFEKIGAQYNVTRERVRQILTKAENRLRHYSRRARLRDAQELLT